MSKVFSDAEEKRNAEFGRLYAVWHETRLYLVRYWPVRVSKFGSDSVQSVDPRVFVFVWRYVCSDLFLALWIMPCQNIAAMPRSDRLSTFPVLLTLLVASDTLRV
jgi:hypothetical protein